MDDIFLLGILRGCPKELQNTLLILCMIVLIHLVPKVNVYTLQRIFLHV